MADKLITIEIFDDYIKADLAKQVLEEQGIKAAITGQNASNAYMGLSAVSTIELLVLESQAEAAKEILKSNRIL